MFKKFLLILSICFCIVFVNCLNIKAVDTPSCDEETVEITESETLVLTGDDIDSEPVKNATLANVGYANEGLRKLVTYIKTSGQLDKTGERYIAKYGDTGTLTVTYLSKKNGLYISYMGPFIEEYPSIMSAYLLDVETCEVSGAMVALNHMCKPIGFAIETYHYDDKYSFIPFPGEEAMDPEEDLNKVMRLTHMLLETLTLNTARVSLYECGYASCYNMSLNAEEIELNVEDRTALKVSFSPSVVKDTVHWKSSDEDVAIVTESGTVYGLKQGTAVITAFTDRGRSASCTVTVTGGEPVSFAAASMTLNGARNDGTSDLKYYSLMPLKVDFSIQNIQKRESSISVETFMYDVSAGDWERQTEIKINIDNSKTQYSYPYTVSAEGLEEGRYAFQVYVSSVVANISIKKLQQTVYLTVERNPRIPDSIAIRPGNVEINAGETVQLRTVIQPSQADQNAAWSVRYGSDNLSVDSYGRVKAIKPGTGIVMATSFGGKQATCNFTISFTDVPRNTKYYSDPVYWAVDQGITNGYKDSDGIIRQFKPQNNCTREAVVTFLWRLAGKPNPRNMNSPFSDIQDRNKYYYKAVLWASENGITKGYSDGTFKPNATCLREHVVTFLYRFAGQPNPGTTYNPFNDVNSSDYYYKAVLWANRNGIANGYNSGRYAGGFGPKLDCLREHVVTFLYRFAK